MRQHLTVEEWNTVTPEQTATFMYAIEGEFLGTPEEITIGVLQAILLEDKYQIIMDPYSDGEVYVLVSDSAEDEGVYTKEPIEVLFQAVKELVLKGVE